MGVNIPETDWIFFSSPTAVKIFLDHYNKNFPLKNKMVGAVGPGTAKILTEAGVKVTFTGDANLSPVQVGIDFADVLKNKTALFPTSQISLRSVSSQIAPEGKIELVIYKTMLNVVDAPSSDIIVFTSPSNVRGYFLKNSPPKETVIFCFGDATEGCLNERGIANPIINLQSSSEEVLVLSIAGLI